MKDFLILSRLLLGTRTYKEKKIDVYLHCMISVSTILFLMSFLNNLFSTRPSTRSQHSTRNQSSQYGRRATSEEVHGSKCTHMCSRRGVYLELKCRLTVEMDRNDTQSALQYFVEKFYERFFLH